MFCVLQDISVFVDVFVSFSVRMRFFGGLVCLCACVWAACNRENKAEHGLSTISCVWGAEMGSSVSFGGPLAGESLGVPQVCAIALLAVEMRRNLGG